MDKNNKNWLYEFEATNSVKKDDGSNEKIIKKFSILRPNRRLREDGELFYAAETSRFAKAGVLPKAAWNTILSDGGGSISEKERELYGNLLLKFRDASFELQSILIKSDSDRTDAEKKRSDLLIQELEEIRREIQSFESSQISIFENTAEAKARNRAILWWLLSLANQKDDSGEYKPLFSGATFEEKLDAYDFIEESEKEDGFMLSVIRRITYLITLWFLGRAESIEDFKQFDDNFMVENSTTQEPEIKETVVVEETVITEDKKEEVKTEEVKKEEAIIIDSVVEENK